MRRETVSPAMPEKKRNCKRRLLEVFLLVAKVSAALLGTHGGPKLHFPRDSAARRTAR
jgi:hypothetical protein